MVCCQISLHQPFFPTFLSKCDREQMVNTKSMSTPSSSDVVVTLAVYLPCPPIPTIAGTTALTSSLQAVAIGTW